MGAISGSDNKNFSRRVLANLQSPTEFVKLFKPFFKISKTNIFASRSQIKVFGRKCLLFFFGNAKLSPF